MLTKYGFTKVRRRGSHVRASGI
ncbi:MAG: hypothetical protein FJ134_04170 [Deltaproteobacteria bacterium]|nr:hypothetical protein [Deltaproteobacteria bacterium]